MHKEVKTPRWHGEEVTGRGAYSKYGKVSRDQIFPGFTGYSKGIKPFPKANFKRVERKGLNNL